MPQEVKQPELSIPNKIASIQDIEIYEKKYGCKYQFVNKWDSKEVYSASEFIKRQPARETGWAGYLIDRANSNIAKCKRKENIMFEWRDGSLKPKTIQ